MSIKETEISWLTAFEERVLEAIIETGSVKGAANELNISPYTIYNILYRVRKKLIKSQNTVNKINVYKKQSNALKRLLVPIQRVKPIELDEEELESWEW
jgi:DNA-binding NarL/FixJ family response regulator